MPEHLEGILSNLMTVLQYGGIGELSGELSSVLAGIAHYQARTQRLLKDLKKALTYPCIVFMVAILVTIILLAKVIPEFALTFSEFNAESPTHAFCFGFI